MTGASGLSRIAVVRLSALGDVLLATPFLRELKRLTGAQVELVTSAPLVPLLQGLPFLDQVTAYAPGMRLSRPDLIIDLQHKARTLWLSFRSGARRRISLRRRTWGQLLRAAIGRDLPVPGPHQTARYFQALLDLQLEPGAPGPLEIGLLPEVREAALRAQPGATGKLLGLAPGAAHATKRWPVERFAEVARAFPDHLPVLLGAQSDSASLDALAASVPRSLDARALDLPALALLIERCALVVSNDSGPVHLAQAVGTPVVALFGPTDPLRWAPRERARTASLRLACSPCSNHGGKVCPLGTHACLRDLPADQVVRLARELVVMTTNLVRP